MTSPEDEVWNPYIETERDFKGLVALVVNNNAPLIVQQRAMDVLLAPDIRKLPFKVNADSMSVSNVGLDKLWIGKVTEEQASFIAKRIPQYIKQVVQAKRENKNNLFIYNNLIPKILDKLAPGEAEKLFESFNINDPLPFYDMDKSSGYNPLGDLYFTEVREFWKQKAAYRIHGIIRSEQTGKTKPREEWEAAFKRYSRILEEVIISNKMPVDRDFCQREVAFMLDVADSNTPIVSKYLTGKVSNLLDNSSLRNRFLNHQTKSSHSDK
jgi:hypothetical protein